MENDPLLTPGVFETLTAVHQVRYFLAICEEGNFTRAAKSCGVKQPSLTRAIQGLESEFGGPLFIRTKKGATLSHLGRLVRTHFLQIRTVLLVRAYVAC